MQLQIFFKITSLAYEISLKNAERVLSLCQDKIRRTNMSKVDINHKIKATKSICSEKERIASGLKRWGQEAYRKALLDGHSTVVLKGNKIYRVTSSGARDVVAEVSQSKYKITQRSFDLNK